MNNGFALWLSLKMTWRILFNKFVAHSSCAINAWIWNRVYYNSKYNIVVLVVGGGIFASAIYQYMYVLCMVFVELFQLPFIVLR